RGHRPAVAAAVALLELLARQSTDRPDRIRPRRYSAQIGDDDTGLVAIVLTCRPAATAPGQSVPGQQLVLIGRDDLADDLDLDDLPYRALERDRAQPRARAGVPAPTRRVAPHAADTALGVHPGGLVRPGHRAPVHPRRPGPPPQPNCSGHSTPQFDRSQVLGLMVRLSPLGRIFGERWAAARIDRPQFTRIQNRHCSPLLTNS